MLISALIIVCRVILFGFGISYVILSFFHGLDLNLGTFVGGLMLMISISPYQVITRSFKSFGLGILIICFIAYSTLLFLIIKLQYNDSINGISEFDLLSYLPLIAPLGCIIIIILLFVKSAEKGIGGNPPIFKDTNGGRHE